MAQINPLEELACLVERANRYDDEARIVLLAYGDTHPEIWAEFQARVAQVEASLVQLATGDEPALADQIAQGLAGLRAQLAGQNPTPIERAIVDLVALRWLQWQHASSLCERQKASSWRLREQLNGRQARCRGQYRAALNSLQKVWRLNPKTVPEFKQDC